MVLFLGILTEERSLPEAKDAKPPPRVEADCSDDDDYNNTDDCSEPLIRKK